MVRKHKHSPPPASAGPSLPGGSSMATSSPIPASSPLVNEGPDPRWPSLHRWSVRWNPASPKSSSKVPIATGNRTVVSSAPAKMASVASPPALQDDEATNTVSAKTTNETHAALPSTPITIAPELPCFPAKSISVEIEPGSEPEGTELETSHAPPLKGAWSSKLNFSNTSTSQEDHLAREALGKWPSLSESQAINRKHARDLQVFEKPVSKEDNIRFPWAAKMNPASRNLYRAIEPEYLADGTPKVTIPHHVLLQGLENQKEYILGQFYRCSPPPGGLVYAVFNKLWGRKCRITIRKLGDSNYLFHIPDESTRTWVLQRGLWHIDDCLMFVAPWNPEATLAIPEIKTIPVWVTLKQIPNILYSIPGISHIASGLGAPMATHKPRLDPILMGEAKILVEVELSKAFPTRIAAGDEKGFISMVDVEYAWLPTKCSRCGHLGHKIKRCLQKEGASQEIVNTVTEIEEENVSEGGNVIKTYVTNSVTNAAPDSAILQKAPRTEEPPSTSQVTTVSTSKSIGPCTVKVAGDPKSSALGSAIDTTSQTFNSPTRENDKIASAKKTPTDVEPITGSTSTRMTKGKEIVNSTQVSTDTPLGLGIRRTLSSGALESNRFSALISSDEEESTDEEESSDTEVSSGEEENVDTNVDPVPTDILSPSGKRFLRERPVQQTTKAKEMQWHPVGGGRGNRGRSNRRGRGRARG